MVDESHLTQLHTLTTQKPSVAVIVYYTISDLHDRITPRQDSLHTTVNTALTDFLTLSLLSHNYGEREASTTTTIIIMNTTIMIITAAVQHATFSLAWAPQPSDPKTILTPSFCPSESLVTVWVYNYESVGMHNRMMGVLRGFNNRTWSTSSLLNCRLSGYVASSK